MPGPNENGIAGGFISRRHLAVKVQPQMGDRYTGMDPAHWMGPFVDVAVTVG
jgi:hypothetical protein